MVLYIISASQRKFARFSDSNHTKRGQACSRQTARIAYPSLNCRNSLLAKFLKVWAIPLISSMVWILVAATQLFAQQSFDLDQFFHRAFLQREFQPKSFGPARWLNEGEEIGRASCRERV